MQNSEIARRLEDVAWLPREQGANPYRVQAYCYAADTLRRLQAVEITAADNLVLCFLISAMKAIEYEITARYGGPWSVKKSLDRERGQVHI